MRGIVEGIDKAKRLSSRDGVAPRFSLPCAGESIGESQPFDGALADTPQLTFIHQRRLCCRLLAVALAVREATTAFDSGPCQ